MSGSRVLVIKAGGTLPQLLQKLPGDFEGWAASFAGLRESQYFVLDATEPDVVMPDPDSYTFCGIIMTAKWIAKAVDCRKFFLGLCYGHQLLAYATGGEVGYNPRGLEFGTVPVSLTAQAIDDPLFSCLSPHFTSPSSASILAHMSHSQTVLRIPASAQLLATSPRDSNAAFCVGGCAWGVQFHPEFSEEAVRGYTEHFSARLQAQGDDPSLLLQGCCETPAGPALLHRFVQLCFHKCT
ncbi:glutamine amidotransferase class-I [Pelomyxa schiedti]|nr:glutamine amidotransferase class-I [Pelomyxa schiedti]